MKRIDISRLRKNKDIHFKISFIIALSMTILAFNYTVYDHEQPIEIEEIITVDETVEVIRTPSNEKPTPPPPKLEFVQKIEEVEETELIEIPKPKEVPLEVPTEVTVGALLPPVVKPTTPKPKPVIIEDKLEEEPLYTIVEFMPEFGDCSVSKDKSERRQVSQKNLLQFIYKHIKYPRIALENGIEGRVFVRFTVNKKGIVQDAEILKEPGGGLGKEVLRVINLMPKWKPGKQGLHKVKVQYTLPVEFKPL